MERATAEEEFYYIQYNIDSPSPRKQEEKIAYGLIVGFKEDGNLEGRVIGSQEAREKFGLAGLVTIYEYITDLLKSRGII